MKIVPRTVLLSTALLGALASTALLGGCNTVEGVGRDIERAGDAISDEARETRRNRD
jgi:predicted small secreted protein